MSAFWWSSNGDLLKSTARCTAEQFAAVLAEWPVFRASGAEVTVVDERRVDVVTRHGVMTFTGADSESPRQVAEVATSEI
ncbi:hypothetical protein [Kineosporia succinea]|uniref:Uncharacterized protein n=1 Tax=Kineosporia succinea TaxID=84632 RepID=A0ABT9PBG4_9ACTN|nr:hypothetical protein [Kineosporia succinea]MDP9829355.1 hypothetical protein [Kineosporia succinea]